MSQQSWNIIKANRYFNVHVYRRGLFILLISLIFNMTLVLIIFDVYINEPEPKYYATSGVTPPVPLKALSVPNMSSTPLLGPDQSSDEMTAIKTIPE